MSDGALFRLWEKTEVVGTQAKNHVWASHVLSFLAVAPGTAAKQVLTSHTHTVNTSYSKLWGFFWCLLSLRMLDYPCALHSRKKDQVLVPEAKRGWKRSGFMAGVGCSAAVSSPGLAGLSSKPSAGQQQELQLRRWDIPARQQVHCGRRHCAGNSLYEVRDRQKRNSYISFIKKCFTLRPWLLLVISPASLIDAISVIKAIVSLVAGTVSAGQEAFPALVTCVSQCLDCLSWPGSPQNADAMPDAGFQLQRQLNRQRFVLRWPVLMKTLSHLLLLGLKPSFIQRRKSKTTSYQQPGRQSWCCPVLHPVLSLTSRAPWLQQGWVTPSASVSWAGKVGRWSGALADGAIEGMLKYSE